jgi:hypothetical protein
MNVIEIDGWDCASHSQRHDDPLSLAADLYDTVMVRRKDVLVVLCL